VLLERVSPSSTASSVRDDRLLARRKEFDLRRTADAYA